jgi:hypothetical protein
VGFMIMTRGVDTWRRCIVVDLGESRHIDRISSLIHWMKAVSDLSQR